MSISSEINRISQNVSSSLTAVANKGVTVPSGSNSDDLPSLIAQITGSGVGAISIADTNDPAGGIIRTITAVDISDTTATANDVASGKYFYTSSGIKTAGTLSTNLQTVTKTYTPTESQQTETITPGSGYDGISQVGVTINAVSSSYVGSGITRRSSSDLTLSNGAVTAPAGYYSSSATKSVATQHVIHLEFDDTTSTNINVYYDDPLIGTMITSYILETYSQKTVNSASLDNVTWYEKPVGTYTTIYDGEVAFFEETQGAYSYCWIGALGDVEIPLGSVWRVTLNNVVYDGLTAVANVTVGSPVIGNPYYASGVAADDDGSGVPFAFFQTPWGAWSGGSSEDYALNYPYSLKVERYDVS